MSTKFKLSPLFMMATIAVIALVPVVFGMTVNSALIAVSLLIAAALMIEPGQTRYTGAMRGQYGKVGDAPDAETQYTEVQADLKKVGDQIKQYAENTEREIKATGELSKETRQRVDEALMKQGELLARVQEVEQKLIAGAGNNNSPEAARSVGQLVAESEEMQGVGSSFRGSRRVQVPRAAITSMPDSGGAMVAPDRQPGVVVPPERRMTIRQLLAPGTTESNSIEYVRETGFVNNARTVSETTGKPYSEITTELKTAAVRVIAHLFKASRQILDDASALRSYIDARARYGLLLAEELQFLYGNGTGVNLHGLIPQAQAYSAPGGVTVVGEQRIDRLRLALLQAELAEFPSNGIVLNPIDWALIELTKDSENRYLIGQPQAGTEARLWNRPVVSTQAMQANEFLVGAFSLGAQIFDRDTIEILISTENDKDFENNMVTLRAEERLAMAVYRPEAFVTGPLANS